MTLHAEDKRLWLVGGTLLALIIAAVAYLGFIGPQLSSAKSLRDEAATVDTQNAALERRVQKLKTQNDNVAALQDELRTALAGLPYDTGLPSFTRQVASQATASGVGLTSITIGSPVPATSATTTGTTGTGTTGSATGATTVLAIPVTLLTEGPAANQATFLKAVQVSGPRRSLVISTAMVSGTGSGSGSIAQSATLTTQLKVFTAPLSAAARAELEKLLTTK